MGDGADGKFAMGIVNIKPLIPSEKISVTVARQRSRPSCGRGLELSHVYSGFAQKAGFDDRPMLRDYADTRPNRIRQILHPFLHALECNVLKVGGVNVVIRIAMIRCRKGRTAWHITDRVTQPPQNFIARAIAERGEVVSRENDHHFSCPLDVRGCVALGRRTR